MSSVFTLHRTHRRGDFDTDDTALLGDLLPHLRRALSVHRTVVDLRASMAQVSGVIDALDIGVMGMGEDRTIRFANAQGEELLRTGRILVSHDGRLSARDPLAQASLGELLKNAFGRSLRAPAAGAVEFSGGGQRLLLTVLPANPYAGIASGPAALVLIVDPDARPQSRERLLGALFGLTPAESRVVMLLLQGLEPKEIGQRTSTTAGTVRFQLKQIYRKCGVGRQSQLVRLISRISGGVNQLYSHMGDYPAGTFPLRLREHPTGAERRIVHLLPSKSTRLQLAFAALLCAASARADVILFTINNATYSAPCIGGGGTCTEVINGTWLGNTATEIVVPGSLNLTLAGSLNATLDGFGTPPTSCVQASCTTPPVF